MKKLIFFLLLLTSCSLNSNNTYWNESSNLKYEELVYNKNYTFDDYVKILDLYNDRKEFPKLN
ncbi:MAG TPA: hypothetical protein QGF37_03430 [Candidatus Pelagibacter bacterium]|jgi:hypothetical protein|nr:hypothetical protein [Pelagibacteraceae bacterium]HJN84556.1 hypothetical protein [Candidatus Pelagibacter bacterium]